MVVIAPNLCTDTKGKEAMFSKWAQSAGGVGGEGTQRGGSKAGFLLFAVVGLVWKLPGAGFFLHSPAANLSVPAALRHLKSRFPNNELHRSCTERSPEA